MSTSSTGKAVRIGGACGFWGDSATATPQLLQVPGLQYLVYDYLAETTMSIMARARARDASLGYATDFVQNVMAPHLASILSQGVKVIANAGGLHPQSCRDALLEVARAQGLQVRIAVVMGDDLMDQWASLHEGLQGSEVGLPEGQKPLSANAYVGARGIACALDEGAQIVITGRCVDSAVVVGALVHEWGWSWEDWDRLSAGTLAGHLIECGAQATGGLFTDWTLVPDWAHMGYPVIDVHEDGSLELFKPEGTGGLIHPGAVAEQILYEVGDPACYLMPDVSCDWRDVRVQAVEGFERVKVEGARGAPPPMTYKANGTWQDGYQLQLMMAIRGMDAPLKAQRTADALLQRTREMLQQQGFADYSETCVELLGAESHYGPHARDLPTREVVLRIAARHPQARALGFLQRECASAGTSMGPGTRSSFFGRSDIQSVIKVFSFMVPKPEVRLSMCLGETVVDVSDDGRTSRPVAMADISPVSAPQTPVQVSGALVDCTLVDLAWARSGDKGDDENIAVIARHPEWLPWLSAQLTVERVRQYFEHLVNGPVVRHDVPGLNAFNFMLHQALGGGGVCSLRSDPLGKSFAQMLLDLPMQAPQAWVQRSRQERRLG